LVGLLESALNNVNEVTKVERFCDVGKRSRGQQSFALALAGIGANDDDRYAFRLWIGFERAQHFLARKVQEVQVQQHKVRPVLAGKV